MSSEHTKHQIKGFIQSDKPGWLQINQLYFVGWNVRIDGEAIETQTLEEAVSSDGLIRVTFPPGRHYVEAVYDGPPGFEFVCLSV